MNEFLKSVGGVRIYSNKKKKQNRIEVEFTRKHNIVLVYLTQRNTMIVFLL